MDQLTAIANTAAGKLWRYSFVYDADGRVTQKTGPLDSTGLPASTTLYASGPDASGANDTVFKSVTVQGAAYNYFYDALNRRRYKSYPTGISDEFFYDLGHQLLVDQGNSTLSPATAIRVLDEYVWLGGRPVAIIRANLTAGWAHQADSTGSCPRNSEAANCGAYFPVTDAIGKAVLMLNAAGRIAGTGEYDPFGHVNRVFVDAETPHPYNPADSTPFADFTQPMGSGMQLDMRVFVDSLDLDPIGAAAGCTAGQGSGDSLRILDGTSNALLASLSAIHDGLLASPWVRPSTGRLKLALSGSGHCEMQQGCAPCNPDPGPCPDCPPGICNLMVCDGISTTTSATGVIAGTYEYRRYESGQQPLWTPLRFPGQYYDAESALFENWNRYYEPVAGVYRQSEPLARSESSAASWAAYAYTKSSPIMSSDGSGLFSLAGYCPNYQKALAIAKEKAGCSKCNPHCQLSCNICLILEDVSWPPLTPTDIPGGCTEGAGCKGASHCKPIKDRSGADVRPGGDVECWSEVLRRFCSDPANVDRLAQALFHEALHYCGLLGGQNPGDSLWRNLWPDPDKAPISWDAKGITDACWK